MNCVSENNFYVTVNDVGECAMGSGVKKLSCEERGFLGLKTKKYLTI